MGYYKDKKVWITGASSGIGEGLALQISKLGGHVILSSRRKAELERVQAALAHPEKSDVAVLDVANFKEIQRVCHELLAKHDIDIVILNAGISQRSNAQSTSFETEDKILDTNFKGPTRIAKNILPHFIDRRKGHFVVMSSVTGKIGVPGRSSYAASKHALHGYFDSLRAEVAESGVDITIICPGYIFTNISKNAVLGDGKPQESIDEKSKNGMSVNRFSEIAVRGIAKRKKELLIGGKEILGVYIKRFFPKLVHRIVKNTQI